MRIRQILSSAVPASSLVNAGSIPIGGGQRFRVRATATGTNGVVTYDEVGLQGLAPLPPKKLILTIDHLSSIRSWSMANEFCSGLANSILTACQRLACGWTSCKRSNLLAAIAFLSRLQRCIFLRRLGPRGKGGGDAGRSQNKP